ncbi:fungal-specific transcription factor domain-containing protein [Radiomyces spectabilis]|uniref:fungal-specific transcription factor domain-containing protein n=1 Tax=Radiomyces spectabilis TaxID=64574 RepID=UPI002220BD3D|nr:fungal-specific transcription factor domain-containing protein [Radiomyces spectabilis]KAI8388893.1 fungal-specific transcription factor domain-containing protein [Radiomyces spectabilis]
MEFAPPPPLGFPCIDFVRDRVKTVFDQLSQEQADVRHSSGEDLVIRHFEVPSYVTSSLPRKPKTKACLSCKSRKLKCDGEQPCVRCIDAGESCQYPPGIQPLPKSTVADSRLTTSGSSHRSSDHTVSADQSISSASHTMHSHHDILSRVNIQQPLITNRFGHYMGETSFYYEVSDTAPSMIEKFPSIANMRAPTFSLDDQAYLIDLYFSFSHPYAPIISKVSLKQQLYQWQLGNPTFLSPLFFFAFFAFASTFSDRADITDKGQKLLTYCNALRDVYLDKPRVSTILALLLMAQHLEQQKLHEKLSRVWIWSGEAFRMTQDMGLHRQCNTTVDGFCKELRIRAFWIAFMADRCLAMVYGRPLVFDERDITVPIPSFTEYDAEEDQQWITNFAVFIDLSRISGRLIKNFYMPQSPIEGPSTP